MTEHVAAGNQAGGCSRAASCRLRVGIGIGDRAAGALLVTGHIVARIVKHTMGTRSDALGREEHGVHLYLQ